MSKVMKLGVLTVALQDRPLDQALGFLQEHGVQMVEIGCGGCPGTAHCDPEILLNDESELKKFIKTVESHHMEISALSVHSNTIHPNKILAQQADYETRRAVRMAEKLGVKQINTFSGCAGDCPESQYPNWVTCPWPEDFLAVLDYQWNQCLIPYWREFVPFAEKHGVNKIAFEPHPGFMVYNPATVLRVREAVGEAVGANLDPSHLIWQGIDPVAAIKELKGAIFHFHAKDTRIDRRNMEVNGVLDTRHYGDVMNRSWSFRTVGYGNDGAFWKDIVSALRLVGYDHAVSIEHEDGLMSGTEGLEKAIAFLKGIIINEPVGEMYWA